MSKQFNESNEKFDTFTKMYHKVLASNELSLLQKYIISDVISFQIKGMPYMRTSKSLAKMLGDYKKDTINKSFQDLAKKGIIVTRPGGYGDKTDSKYDLRFAEVLNIDQWIRSDEYLESIGFVPEEVIPQSNWTQSKTNTKEAKAKRQTEDIININLNMSEAIEVENSTLVEEVVKNEEEITKSNEKVINNQRTIFDEIIERELVESTPMLVPQVQNELLLVGLDELSPFVSSPAQEELVLVESEVYSQTSNLEVLSSDDDELDSDFIFDDYITLPKRIAISRYISSKTFEELNSFDDFSILNEDFLNAIFGFNNDVWLLFDFEMFDEVLIENQHGITLSSKAKGDLPKLTCYENNEKYDSYRISKDKLEDYYKKYNKEFKDLKKRDFQILSASKFNFDNI
jgi:hypothetical protein